MTAERIQTQAVTRFSCLGDQCPDTCCKGWDMQVAQPTADLYAAQAPQLLDSLTTGAHSIIMKRDPATDYCVKFDAGWCSIHRDHGPKFLGDACDLYPRVTRALDATVHTTLALSCPEAARLLLSGDEGFAPEPREELRVPFMLKNYLLPGMTPEQGLAIHHLFLHEAANPAYSPERNALRLLEVAHALEAQPPEQWEAAAKFYVSIADGRLPAPEPHAHDLVHLVQALVGLIMAGQATGRTALMAITQRMQDALGMRIDPVTRALHLEPDVMVRGLGLLRNWREHHEQAQRPALTRYLQAQLSQALFPLAGLGAGPVERMTMIAVRLATVRLALMTHAEGLDAGEVVRLVYTLSRFLDHLADPTLSLAIYQETGWVRTARLRALLGDA